MLFELFTHYVLVSSTAQTSFDDTDKFIRLKIDQYNLVYCLTPAAREQSQNRRTID